MADDRPGIRFPVIDGRRSSSRTGADIVADSLVRVDGRLAGRAREASEWRKTYAEFFADSTRASASAKDSVAIAEYGLQSAWDRLVFRAADGSETPVTHWARNAPESPDLGTGHVAGTADAVTRLDAMAARHGQINLHDVPGY